jgi:hypothetical protein
MTWSKKELVKPDGSQRASETITAEDFEKLSVYYLGCPISFHEAGLRAPECLPVFLPDLQRPKDIDRKTRGHLSLGFIPHDLFVQNKRHGF